MPWRAPASLLAAVLLPASLGAGQPTLVLVDGGIRFPDGTIQETSGVLAPGPPTLTVPVDCAAGETVAAALRVPAGALTVEISGLCSENVEVRRPYVTLRGTNPFVDGIQPGPGLPSARPLSIADTFSVTVENLRLTGGVIGVGVNSSFSVAVTNCRLEGNSVGAIVGTGGSAFFTNTVFTGNSLWGLSALAGSFVTCVDCTVESNGAGGLGRGIVVRQGSELNLSGGTIRGGRALDLLGGSRVAASAGTAIEGIADGSGQGASLLVSGTSSADLTGSALVGPLLAFQKSAISLTGSSQTIPGSFVAPNQATGDSTLRVLGGTSLAGNLQLREFSNAVLALGTSVSGDLTCSSAGDAFCDDPAVVAGTSNCARCLKP